MGQGKNENIQYTITIVTKCLKELKSKRVDPTLRKEINKNIEELKTNPFLGRKLKEFSVDVYRIRLDKYKYRIIYQVDSTTVIILLVERRTEKTYSKVQDIFESGK